MGGTVLQPRAASFKTVLGIDAAWTENRPSGVALIQGNGSSWRWLAVAPSYAGFISGAPINWSAAPPSGALDVAALLAAAQAIAGAPVDLITIDMPVAMTPINCRRAADDEISRKYGGQGCSVHSPTPHRPGATAHRLCREFAAKGYPLATNATTPGNYPALVEVFPHTALLALLGAPRRVLYKFAKSAKYLPGLSLVDRRTRILSEWYGIMSHLGRTIQGIALPLPPASAKGSLKRYEDALDALICAWVGVEYLAGRTVPHGDSTTAIWSP